MKAKRYQAALIALAAVFALVGCGKPDARAATRETFESGLRTFLADGHGQLCLGMYDWPIDLSEAEAGAHSRHAVQLPVFEKLGLAISTVVSVPNSAESPDGAIKRYALTEEGRKYYRAHAHTGRDGVAHSNDLCVARISLDKVEEWQLDTHDAEHPAASVSYSYHIEPAPWLRDSDAQRVLPMVAKVIQGADGRLLMHQGFALSQAGWVAVPGPV